MAVHLRLARTGRHKRPMYRVIAADSRKPRDGRFLEILGIFDPLKNPAVPEVGDSWPKCFAECSRTNVGTRRSANGEESPNRADIADG